MLKAEHIVKTYNAGKKTALEDFNIEVPQGSIYGLLGPNGAGKTTFIRIINQITKPDAGAILINQQKLNPQHIHDIGYMPEERGLYKNMTLGDQLIYFGGLKGMSKKSAIEQAQKWFERLHIEEWWNKKLSELSKGMAQKIQFVVTVLHQPKLLILDEPFSGFDPVNSNLIKDQIIRLKNEGTTIILSTHRMESVEEMCDYVALINQSKKVLDGKLFDIKEQFKKNIFTVSLSEADEEKFRDFKQNHYVESIASNNGVLSFDLSNINHQSEVLEELLQIGEIRTFQEKIPTMNDVFITVVNQTTHHE